MTVNYVAIFDSQQHKWLIDSAASLNITSDIINLSIHSEYDDTDEIVLDDDTVLTISQLVH